jgi:hypothetical protein
MTLLMLAVPTFPKKALFGNVARDLRDGLIWQRPGGRSHSSLEADGGPIEAEESPEY